MIEKVNVGENNILNQQYRGRLTEGITYNPSNNTILWVDIIKGEVHRLWLGTENKHEMLKFEDAKESIGAIGLTSNDNVIIICGKYGVAEGNFINKTIKYFLMYNHDDRQKHRLRSNDGAIDPWGHLWVGVMTDFDTSAAEGLVSAEGRLYRINCHDLTIETMIDNTFISNGLLFTGDGKTLYWTDSLTHTIWQYDYSYITNTLSNKRPFIEVSKVFGVPGGVAPSSTEPEPDGIALTRDNEVFSAMFHTGKVLRFNSQGHCTHEYELPATRVTSVTVGGKNSDVLFITTGHPELERPEASIDPADKSGDLGGFIFAFSLPEPVNVLNKSIWGRKV